MTRLVWLVGLSLCSLTACSGSATPSAPPAAVRPAEQRISVHVDGRTITGHCNGVAHGTPTVVMLMGDGQNERGLAVLQIGNGTVTTISPAPRSFGASGT